MVLLGMGTAVRSTWVGVEGYGFTHHVPRTTCLPSHTTRSASGVLHLASCIWRPASGVQHLASSIWRPASGVQHLASSIWRPASGVQHLSFDAVLGFRGVFGIGSLAWATGGAWGMGREEGCDHIWLYVTSDVMLGAVAGHAASRSRRDGVSGTVVRSTWVGGGGGSFTC